MSIKNLDGEKVAVSPEQMQDLTRQQARAALVKYERELEVGGNPVYPQWAADILKETA